MYSAERTLALPPKIVRWPRMLPESRLNGARLISALISLRERWVFRNKGGDFHARGLITRHLSNSNPVRPYICRFSIFRRFTWPLRLLLSCAAQSSGPTPPGQRLRTCRAPPNPLGFRVIRPGSVAEVNGEFAASVRTGCAAFTMPAINLPAFMGRNAVPSCRGGILSQAGGTISQ